MADAPAFAFYRGEMFQAILLEVMGRWMQGIYLYSGGLVAPASGMDISIDAATSPYGSTAGDASFTIDAAHATLARIDILYISAAGAWTIRKGDNAAIVDPMGNGDWREYVAPSPKHSRLDPLPAGVATYFIYVAPGATEITADDIQSIAAIGRDPVGYSYVTAPIEVDHAATSPVALGTAPANSIVEPIIRCSENNAGANLFIGDEDDPDSLCTSTLLPVATTDAPVVGPLGSQYYAASKALRATIDVAGTAGKWLVQFRIVLVV